MKTNRFFRFRFQSQISKQIHLYSEFLKWLLVGVDRSVHLVELKDSGELYAMKAMEKSVMLNRNKVIMLKSQNFVCPNFSIFCLYFLRFLCLMKLLTCPVCNCLSAIEPFQFCLLPFSYFLFFVWFLKLHHVNYVSQFFLHKICTYWTCNYHVKHCTINLYKKILTFCESRSLFSLFPCNQFCWFNLNQLLIFIHVLKIPASTLGGVACCFVLLGGDWAGKLEFVTPFSVDNFFACFNYESCSINIF